MLEVHVETTLRRLTVKLNTTVVVLSCGVQIIIYSILVMPPRPQPKIYQLQFKTHRITIALSGVAPSALVSELKDEILDALSSNVSPFPLDFTIGEDQDSGEDPVLVPPPTSTNDFEICKLPSKRQLQAQSLSGGFEILDPQKPVRDCGISGWEVLFLQFNNPETHKPLPITYFLPSIDDDEDDVPLPSVREMDEDVPSSETSVKRKGKRKADSIDS